MSWLSSFIHQIGLDHLLPKDTNSVSDVEDKLKQTALPGVLHSLAVSGLARATTDVATALHNAETAAETDVAKVQAVVTHTIVGTLGLVDPALATAATDVVNSAITSAEHWAEGAAEGIAASLIKALAAKLGIG